MRTTLHAYRFDTTKPEEEQAYQRLRVRLGKTNGECFETWGGGSHYLPALDGQEVELETAHLFGNQWDTAAPHSRRVFDWAQDYHSRELGTNPRIKQGHYLDITPEMTAARNNTLTCGYCGRQEPLSSGLAFCPHCLGSEYLKAEDLRLTRMLPVSANQDRKELTSKERAERLPLFVKAQTEGITERDKQRIAKERADVIAKHEKDKATADEEYHGKLWLMDHGLRLDNVIYYSHTRRFCFGWRTPLSGELLSRVVEIVTEFPYDYDIKQVEAAPKA